MYIGLGLIKLTKVADVIVESIYNAEPKLLLFLINPICIHDVEN